LGQLERKVKLAMQAQSDILEWRLQLVLLVMMGVLVLPEMYRELVRLGPLELKV
jgi:hypothetical protein